MAWSDALDGAEAHRLAAEVSNEPQWVVFDDSRGEEWWATHELEELAGIAAWWAAVHT